MSQACLLSSILVSCSARHRQCCVHLLSSPLPTSVSGSLSLPVSSHVISPLYISNLFFPFTLHILAQSAETFSRNWYLFNVPFDTTTTLSISCSSWFIRSASIHCLSWQYILMLAHPIPWPVPSALTQLASQSLRGFNCSGMFWNGRGLGSGWD